MPNNTIVIHDSEYEMTAAYLNGAQAFREGVPWSCNPHRHGSMAHDGWSDGHCHESAHEHFRFGMDLLRQRQTGQRFEMDEAVPRKFGDVDPDWASLNVSC